MSEKGIAVLKPDRSLFVCGPEYSLKENVIQARLMLSDQANVVLKPYWEGGVISTVGASVCCISGPPTHH